MTLAFRLDISFMANNCLAPLSYFQLAVRDCVYVCVCVYLCDVGNATPLLTFTKNFIYTKRCLYVLSSGQTRRGSLFCFNELSYIRVSCDTED